MPTSVLYAFYLACSWLWCIGAFLPLLLLRDYGWVSLAVFVVSNLAGAAAFGWLMTRQKQPAFLATHRRMLSLFSWVTLTFQLFFVVWISALVGWWLLLAMLLFISLFYQADRIIHWVAAGVFLLSLLLFGHYLFTAPTLPPVKLELNGWHTLLPIALGFALSPYLDLTFHRVVQLSPHPRLSFGLGFGVFFLILLIFVFFYIQDLNALVISGEFIGSSLWPVVVFILLQTAFTTALHLKESQRLHPIAWLKCLGWGAAYLVLLVWLLNTQVLWILPWLDLPFTELIYKTFLLFYGLLTPLYLLLGQKRTLFWIALALTAPAYSLGFILGGDFLWLLTGCMVSIALLLLYQQKLNPQHKASRR